MSAERRATAMPWDGVPDPLSARALSDEPSIAAPPREPSPTRAVFSRRVGLALALSAGSWLGLLVVLGPRADLARQLPVLVASSLAAALGLMLAVRHAWGLPPEVRALRAVVLGAPLAFACAVVAQAAVSGPRAAGAGGSGEASAALVCTSLGALFTVAPLGAIVVVLARSFVSASALRGAALGAVAGLAGAVGIHAHCPREGLVHALLGHGLPIVVASALGALGGRLRGRA
jgi:hypothetical protein